MVYIVIIGNYSQPEIDRREFDSRNIPFHSTGRDRSASRLFSCPGLTEQIMSCCVRIVRTRSSPGCEDLSEREMQLDTLARPMLSYLY